MRSWPKPTPELLEQARAKLGRAGVQGHFFESLKNPEWLEPLAGQGWFEAPPPAVRDKAANTIAYPSWSPAAYLKAMAAERPEKVAEICARVPDTDNIRVHLDLVDIALKLPPQLAVALAQRAKSWTKADSSFLLWRPVAFLIVRLAEGGEHKTAFSLASAVFRVDAEDGADPLMRRRGGVTNWLEVAEYEQGLNIVSPALRKLDARASLQMLCGLLEAAVVVPAESGGTDFQDYSNVWRKDVGASDEIGNRNVESILVDAVRETALALANHDEDRVRDVVEKLVARRWTIFRRIALNVVAATRPAGAALAETYLTDRSIFSDHRYEREYARLLEARFPDLSALGQTAITGWIESGPDLHKVTENYRAWNGKTATPEMLAHHRKYWTRDRLLWFGASLPMPLSQTLASLLEDIGEPDEGEGMWFGPTSPVTEEDLAVMPMPELAKLLHDWVPPDSHRAASRDGLANALRATVLERAPEFANSAQQFRDLAPVYLHHLIWGLGDAAKGQSLDWGPILDLCDWVLAQPRGTEPRDQVGGEDHSWEGTRRFLAHMLIHGLQNQSSGLAAEHGDRVWKILTVLMQDPDPTATDEADRSGDVDAATRAFNTVRGVALHAVIQFVLWKRRLAGAVYGGAGFDDLPEAEKLLGDHLDPAIDPSVWLRGVYGQWLPWLVSIDAGWCGRNLDKILPIEEPMRAYWDAAWSAYIQFNNGYDNVFAVIGDRYRVAVNRIDGVPDRRQNLGPHLMTFYWRGKIALEDSAVGDFFRKADSETRAAALGFVGRSLLNTAEALPSEIVQRLTALWESRVKALAGEGDCNSARAQLESFASWFRSQKLPLDWALGQLEKILAIISDLRYAMPIIESLTGCVQERPVQSVRILKALLLGPSNNWQFLTSGDSSWKVLDAALRSDSPEAQELAREAINGLGARGSFVFRPLLQQMPGHSADQD
jgi:hypothetical protein